MEIRMPTPVADDDHQLDDKADAPDLDVEYEARVRRAFHDPSRCSMS